MMDLAMNFDTDECLVTAMFDKGNRNDTMEAIDHIIPFLKGDADMIGLVCNTIRKLFCMSDEGYEIFLMDLDVYKRQAEYSGTDRYTENCKEKTRTGVIKDFPSEFSLAGT